MEKIGLKQFSPISGICPSPSPAHGLEFALSHGPVLCHALVLGHDARPVAGRALSVGHAHVVGSYVHSPPPAFVSGNHPLACRSHATKQKF